MPKVSKDSKQTKLKTISTTSQAASSNAKPSASTKKNPNASPKKRSKDPKDSHLYTDDNPETTLKGTGFKDSDAAKNTVQLVSQRSLTYQFQTINTMYHRALHHPHPTPGIKGAIAVFKEWLEVTYPTAKAGLRAGGFKPVLPKDTVAVYASRCRSVLKADELRFMEMYIDLPSGKRLANVLLNDAEPGGRDWERERLKVLSELVEEGKEESKAWKGEEVWDEEKQPTEQHLRLIAWGWSPVPARTLAGRAKALKGS